jgi:metal-responsive CopG/Arc/MetJ family transcriptional regulator
MKTIRVILDAGLLRAADHAAKSQKISRSALIRRALREHLKRMHGLDLEARDRRGYRSMPQRIDEPRPWEQIEAWAPDHSSPG